VRVAIEKHRVTTCPPTDPEEEEGEELWSASISSGDSSVHTPTDVDAVEVQALDNIYFRVQPGPDGRADEVHWDPAIHYEGLGTPLDANKLDQASYQASTDFTLGGRPGIVAKMPFKGTVHVTGTLHKSAPTTDDVKLQLLHNDEVEVEQMLQTVVSNGDIAFDQTIDVERADRLALRVAVDSPIDLRAISFTVQPQVTYESAEDSNGNPVTVKDLDDIPMLQIRLPYDINVYSQPLRTSPYTGVGVATPGSLTGHAEIRGSTSMASGPVVFTVKKRSDDGSATRQEKHTLQLNGTALVQSADFTLNLEEGDTFFFEFSSTDPTAPMKLDLFRVVFETGQTLPGVLNSPTAPGIFPSIYRGWAVAGYQGNGERATELLKECDFVYGYERRIERRDLLHVRQGPAHPSDAAGGPDAADDLRIQPLGPAQKDRLGSDGV
jgi:hypothetical protein